ncbi:hypothetical protein OROMI_019992 [Orobanche minor]
MSSSSLVPENHMRSDDTDSTPTKRVTRWSSIHDDDHSYDYKKRKVISKQRKPYCTIPDDKVSGKILAACSKSYKVLEEIYSAENLPSLPEDIIAEIFGRLPVKSLQRFRCISKYWNSFISSKKFVKTHLEISARNPKFSHHNLISITRFLYMWTERTVPRQHSLQSLLYDHDSYAAYIYFPKVDPSGKEDFLVIGCCNGLCCLVGDADTIVLLNPCTKKYKILPDIDCFADDLEFLPDSFGFGVSDDGNYKLVCVGALCSHSGKPPAGAGAIYTLKTNSWRMVHDMEYILPVRLSSGLFTNGKFHWLVLNGSGGGHSIVSFDFGTETDGVLVYLPDNVRDGFTPSSLGELGGSLSLILDYPEVSKEIWVLKEYGINKSWIKAFTVPNAGHPWSNSIRDWGELFKLLCFSVEGELLFVYGSSFIIYNPKNQSFRSLPITNFPKGYAFFSSGNGPPVTVTKVYKFVNRGNGPQVMVYVESLVSHFPDAHLDE